MNASRTMLLYYIAGRSRSCSVGRPILGGSLRFPIRRSLSGASYSSLSTSEFDDSYFDASLSNYEQMRASLTNHGTVSISGWIRRVKP